MTGIIVLPATLSPSAATYLAALVQRDQQTDAAAAVFLGKNYAFNGVPGDSYSLLARLSRFAWAGNLTADYLATAPETAVGNALPVLPPEAPTSSPFPLVAGCNIQLTGPDQIIDDITDFDSLAGQLLVFIDSEIMSISAAQLTGAGAYSLTLVRGFFGTSIADHLNGAAVFIVRRGDIVPFTHPLVQAGNTLQLKVTVGTGSVSDAAEFDYAVLPLGSGDGLGLDLT